MSLRPLQRIRCISPSILNKLKLSHIATAQDLLIKSDLDLCELLDLTLDEANLLINNVSEAIITKSQTALSLYENTIQMSSISLNSNIPYFQICHSGVTELVGAAGLGKTQTCLTLCVETLKQNIINNDINESVIYIDTEGVFSGERCLEIAKSRYPASFPTADQTDKLLNSIYIYRENSSQSLLHRLKNLESIIIEKNVKLLILDGIAAPIRSEFSSANLPQRQEILSKIAGQLKYLSEIYKFPCIVTNQVATKFEKQLMQETVDINPNNINNNTMKSSLTAALGVSWAHAVNTRYIIEQVTDKQKSIKIGKSPIYPIKAYVFEISAKGIEININPIKYKDMDFSNLNVFDMSISRFDENPLILLNQQGEIQLESDELMDGNQSNTNEPAEYNIDNDEDIILEQQLQIQEEFQQQQQQRAQNTMDIRISPDSDFKQYLDYEQRPPNRNIGFSSSSTNVLVNEFESLDEAILNELANAQYVPKK